MGGEAVPLRRLEDSPWRAASSCHQHCSPPGWGVLESRPCRAWIWLERTYFFLSELIAYAAFGRKRYDDQSYPTLGLFRPKIIQRLIIEAEDPNWSESQLAALRQGLLFEKGPDKELEKVPFSFRYQFLCDEGTCSGHRMICTDWEMGQSWRSWKSKYW